MTAMGKVSGVALALIGAAFTKVDPSLLAVLAGVIVYAAASWRRDTREILRRQNEDLATRNATLESENSTLEAEKRLLEKRPDVDALAAVVEDLVHYSKERDTKILNALEGVAQTIKANTDAVRLWATQRAGDL